MNLLWPQLQKFVNIQLVKALNKLLWIICILLKNERDKVNHFPDKRWRLKCVKKINQFGVNNKECLQIINLIVMNF